MSSLFHYTTIDAFQKMFTGTLSKEHLCNMKSVYTPWNSVIIHLSHIRYLNDKLEYEYFNNLLWKAIHKYDRNINKEHFLDFVNINSIFSAPFIFSLSEIDDSLPMWKMYSDDAKGVMIEFDKDLLERELPLPQCSLAKCVYDKELDNSELVSECIKYIRQERSSVIDILHTMNLNLRKNLVLYKSTDFSYEQEWRIFLKSEINLTKVSNGLIKQYTDFAISATCIKSVTLGPCVTNSNLQKDSINHLLSTKGLINIKAKDSLITEYRNI